MVNIFYLLIILGIAALLLPKVFWTIGGGFKHKDLQPSISFMVAIRALGIILLVLGLAYYFTYK